MMFTGLCGFAPAPTKGSNCRFIHAATCDFIFLCVPIPAFEDVVKQLLPVMKKGAVLIDVSTVKKQPVEVLQRRAMNARVWWIPTHPLFGPESFAANGNSLKGLPLVVCEEALAEPALMQMAYDLFVRGSGLKLFFMSADEHDKTIGVDQFVIQYFGRCIEDVEGWGEGLRVQTYSSSLFHKAMRLMKGDEKLFWWVYEYNPHCRAIVQRIEDNVLKMRERRNGHPHVVA